MFTRRRGHLSVLEHRQTTLVIPWTACRTLAEMLRCDSVYDLLPLVHQQLHSTLAGRFLHAEMFAEASGISDDFSIRITGNLHAWYDFLNAPPVLDAPVFRENSWLAAMAYIVMEDAGDGLAAIAAEVAAPTRTIHRELLGDRFGGPYVEELLALVHFIPGELLYTASVIASRGVMDEYFRHRVALMMRPTRYVAEASKIRVVDPGTNYGWDQPGWRNWLKRRIWATAMWCAGAAYFALRRLKCSAQEARSVLPLSLATEGLISATAAEWHKILDLRLAPSAHPDARQLATDIKDVLALWARPTDESELDYPKELPMLNQPVRKSDCKVEMGTFLPVINRNPFPTAAREYIVVHGQCGDVGAEFPLMFTAHELTKVVRSVQCDYFNTSKPGHFHYIKAGKTCGYFVRMRPTQRGELKLYFVCTSTYERAKRRAERNPEDVPKKSFLTDLLD